MKEKSSSTTYAADGDEPSQTAGVGDTDLSMDKILERLPSTYRKEILKQYDVPTVDISIFDILRYGTRLDFVMQVIGTICAIAAGKTLEN
jgi:hypothetical protein